MSLLRNEVLKLLPQLIPYAILTAIIAIIIHWYIQRRQKVLLIEKIPGPKALPLLGNVLDVKAEPRELFQRAVGLAHIWGWTSPFIRVWIGHRPCLLIYKSQQAEAILSSNKHLNKSSEYSFLHPWLGTGLLTATGQKWHARRKLLTRAFHFKILEDFVEVFNSQCNVMVNKLQKVSDGKPFDIFPYITLCTLDIICETAMGLRIHAQEESDSDYVRAVHKIAALVQKRQVSPWMHPNILFKLLGYAKEQDAALKILHDMSYDCIQEKRAAFLEKKNMGFKCDDYSTADGKKNHLAFLDLLLEAADKDPSITLVDIREEVDTFMFEGHDTTAAAINWCLYLLGCHPEIQARVHQELDSVLDERTSSITMEDLRCLKYLENCIKEALRLFPSIPFIARELTEDAFIDNYRIPAGTTAMIMTYSLHRDPKQFPRPEVFDPDRFLPENIRTRHTYSYVPFSAGPRNCIGQKFAMMEEKILLSRILKNFRVESTTRREDLRLLGEITLKPEEGNQMKFYPRAVPA